jgi:hypothetical protein
MKTILKHWMSLPLWLDLSNQELLQIGVSWAGSIKSRAITDWSVMIVTDEKHRDVVSKNAEKLLFD